MAVISEINLSDLKSGFRMDSEFYKPDYILLENELKSFNCKKIKHFAKVTDGEHGSVIPRESGVKYLTAENVKNGYIDISKIRYVDEKVDNKNKRASVRVGDVLISIKGTLGEVAVAEEWLLPANMNRDVAIIKPFENADIQSEYLTIFLMSKFGAFQAKREGSGGVQQMITLERLREFLIPKISIEDQIKIKELYSESLNQKSLAESSCTQATSLLEKELGLDKVHIHNQKAFSVNTTEIVNKFRFDAEFYNPKLKAYYQYFENSLKADLKPITFLTKVFKFSNPEYSPNGTPIITQKHLGSISPESYGSELLTSDSWVSKNLLSILKQNDLLFYSVGAYLGKTNIWLNKDKAVPASFITILRCEKDFDAGFLMVLLNSKYGLLQSKVYQSGTSQQYIYPNDIRKFKIPIIDNDLKKELYSLIVKSFDAANRSKFLLGEAKAAVETIIESAVIKAI